MPDGPVSPKNAGIAAKATAPLLLIDGCSELVKGGFDGSFRGVTPRAVAVNISGAPRTTRKATSATAPPLLMTGSPKDEISGLRLVSTISTSAPDAVKTPLLPSRRLAE